MIRHRLSSTLIAAAIVAGLSTWFASRGPAQPPADDKAAILKASRDFAQAFEKADAKAVAAFWTENGEYLDDKGAALRGRADIEKAFAEFFKNKPKTKVEVLVETVRFPAKDLAIEEGILRQTAPGELPASTHYSVLHIREGGVWKIAQSKEWGAGGDRLADLEWLVGTWTAAVKDKSMTLTFDWNKTNPFVTGTFVTKTKDKTLSAGKMKIGFDAQRGRIRSWTFDDDGGHGQALWIRDGNKWVLDSVGSLANGTPTASLNIITRLGDNDILWRSIDRVIGGDPAPDTVPIKLTRAASK